MNALDSLTSNATTLIDRPFEDYALLNSLTAKFTACQPRDTRLDSLPSFFWGYLVYSSGTRFGEKRELRTRSRVQRVQEPFNLYLSKAHRFCTLAVKRGTHKIFLADSMTGNSVKQCTFVWDGSSAKSFGIKDETSGRTAVGGIFLEKDQICPLQDGSIISFAKANGTVQDYVFYQAATKAPKSSAELYKGNIQAGAGVTSCVKVVRQKANGAQYAIKGFKFYELATNEHIIREVLALSKLSHPGICELYEVYNGGAGRISELVIEYVTGDNLATYLERFGAIDETKSRYISFQLCDTLAYIHSQGVIHGDIKPENILIIEYVPPKVKINDFGSAQITTSGSLEPCGGTLAYAAPEALHRSLGPYTAVADMWSLGATLFYMLTKQRAYRDPGMVTTGRRKQGLPLNLQPLRLISPEACDLIGEMLTEDVGLRIPAAAALQHTWLKGFQYPSSDPSAAEPAYAYTDLTPTERCSPPPYCETRPEPVQSVLNDDLKCSGCHQKMPRRKQTYNESISLLKCVSCRKNEKKNLTRVRDKELHRSDSKIKRKSKPRVGSKPRRL
ncbi:kinase-like protein [Agrocybe pediades]|nr:kinase-like protein [Agrocybe pediades]